MPDFRVPPPPRYLTLESGAGHTATVMDIGATLLSCRVPMADGSRRETVLGHPAALDDDPSRGYAGAIVGRYANRIAGAAFELDGRRHQLQANENGNQLHGGVDGFHRRRWQFDQTAANRVQLNLLSPDGDQGFPGEVEASVTYTISAHGVLRIDLRARSSAPCPVSLSNHAYFNLDARHGDARDHLLQLRAPAYAPVDDQLIPQGALVPVEDSSYDFRAAKSVRAALDAAAAAGTPGFDHAWLLSSQCAHGAVPAARLQSSDRTLAMTISTSLPAIQFYDGRHLHTLHDRDGRPYPSYAGFALEPEYLPDSPNRPDWPQPSCILRPGTQMHHFIELAFQASA
ncbi:galactose-1-epimerase [Duganella sp. Dugasp56]|uniref:galactose-1-epimerase n=1 Tax=Duganella sp. Dugasp56 TaxID=3243046 RepID=UPI0039AEFA2C